MSAKELKHRISQFYCDLSNDNKRQYSCIKKVQSHSKPTTYLLRFLTKNRELGQLINLPSYSKAKNNNYTLLKTAKLYTKHESHNHEL